MKAASEKMANDEQIIDEEFGVFSKFFDAKDPSTSGHSSRVAEYSKLIAQKMGRNADECRQIYYIALMHDTGKVRTPDSILKKPGKLTPEEYDIIKLHTTDGASILSDFRSIESIRDGALYHHERYDGNGYPTGRSGLDIPFIGRLICVADSFDAMNSRRCYRSRLSRDKIISEIKDNRGTQFDPDIADALLSLIDEKVITIDECNE
jgi:putative nucleotidyltransferase with HDIG domain